MRDALSQRDREKEALLRQVDELQQDLDVVADELERERLQGARNADGTDLEKVRPLRCCRLVCARGLTRPSIDVARRNSTRIATAPHRSPSTSKTPRPLSTPRSARLKN